MVLMTQQLLLSSIGLWLFFYSPAGLLAQAPTIEHDTDNGWTILWPSVPGQYYAIETSVELEQWSALDRAAAASGPAMQHTISEDLALPAFFRVRENAFVDRATPPAAQPNLTTPTGDNWVLEFSDEFNAFDPNKWNITVSTRTRAPRWDKGIQQWYWVKENVSVADGKLVLKVTKPNSFAMHCSSIDTKNIYEPKFGYYEVRMQIAPVANAIHTAFWLQGHNMSNIDGSGADGAEVDIVETPWADERAQTVIHWDGYGPDKGAATNRWAAPGIHTGYHTFAAHWTENFIDIYFNGQFRWRYTGIAIPKVGEWLWVSVGASFGDGDFRNGTYPSFAYVDYVRVWRSDLN